MAERAREEFEVKDRLSGDRRRRRPLCGRPWVRIPLAHNRLHAINDVLSLLPAPYRL